MTNPDFQSMTKAQLRAYVLTNRDDDEAFHAYVDKVRESPRVEITSEEQFERLVREKTLERAKEAESMNVKQMIIDEMEGCPNYALLEVLSHLLFVKARINKLGY
jgi:hypothetical protein